MVDLNVWIALSFGSHSHSKSAWAWLQDTEDDEIVFCRLTQVGLIRLLNTKAVMGPDCHTIKSAWAVYDRWLQDPRVRSVEDPLETQQLFRSLSLSLGSIAAPKAIVDCYLLAVACAMGMTLVTMDAALAKLATKSGCPSVLLP